MVRAPSQEKKRMASPKRRGAKQPTLHPLLMWRRSTAGRVPSANGAPYRSRDSSLATSAPSTRCTSASWSGSRRWATPVSHTHTHHRNTTNRLRRGRGQGRLAMRVAGEGDDLAFMTGILDAECVEALDAGVTQALCGMEAASAWKGVPNQ